MSKKKSNNLLNLIKEIRDYLSHCENEFGIKDSYNEDTIEGHANKLLNDSLPYLDINGKVKILDSLKFEIDYEEDAKKDKRRPAERTEDYHEGYIDGLKRAVELVKMINEQDE
jgi:hypothetical protein